MSQSQPDLRDVVASLRAVTELMRDVRIAMEELTGWVRTGEVPSRSHLTVVKGGGDDA